MGFEDTIEAVWAWDEETGEQLLIGLKSGRILARKNKNGEIVDETNGQ